MKKLFLLLLVCAAPFGNQLYAQGSVNFDLSQFGTATPIKVRDFDGTLLQGTAFWTQLYTADGWFATVDLLSPKGIPVNFRKNFAAGWPQVTGTNALGQAVSPSVPVSAPYSAEISVQWRAWSGPFTSYEAAKAGGGRFGSSRILRMHTQNPAATPAILIDTNGPINGFTLDPGQPALSVNDIAVAEGTNGTVNAVFTVRLSVTNAQAVTVDYATADGTALAGSDYVATSGTLTFTPGQTSQTITVAVTADGPPESDESFAVTLSNAANAVIARAQATCTITEVRIAGISVNTSVSFNTVLNHTYVVERTDNVALIDWTPVVNATNVLGTGNIVTVIDPGAGCEGLRFYRARLVQ